MANMQICRRNLADFLEYWSAGVMEKHVGQNIKFLISFSSQDRTISVCMMRKAATDFILFNTPSLH